MPVPTRERCTALDRERLENLVDSTIKRTEEEDSTIHTSILIALEVHREFYEPGGNQTYRVGVDVASEASSPDELLSAMELALKDALSDVVTRNFDIQPKNMPGASKLDTIQ
jgi:hypothetical protein